MVIFRTINILNTLIAIVTIFPELSFFTQLLMMLQAFDFGEI